MTIGPGSPGPDCQSRLPNRFPIYLSMDRYPIGVCLGSIAKQQRCEILEPPITKVCRRLAALQLWSSSREAMGQEYQCSDQSTRCTSPTCACTGGNGTNKGHPSLQHNYWKAGCCCDCFCLQENTARKRKRKILKSMCSALHERGMEEERRELESPYIVILYTY